MRNEEVFKAITNYQQINGKRPTSLKMNPTYFRNLLKELNYPEWLIEQKATEKTKSLLGISVELTDELKTFKIYK